jgi:hypothetical protein
MSERFHASPRDADARSSGYVFMHLQRKSAWPWLPPFRGNDHPFTALPTSSAEPKHMVSLRLPN